MSSIGTVVAEAKWLADAILESGAVDCSDRDAAGICVYFKKTRSALALAE